MSGRKQDIFKLRVKNHTTAIKELSYTWYHFILDVKNLKNLRKKQTKTSTEAKQTAEKIEFAK